jgi:Peptidase C26
VVGSLYLNGRPARPLPRAPDPCPFETEGRPPPDGYAARGSPPSSHSFAGASGGPTRRSLARAYGGALEQHLADRLERDIQRCGAGEFADPRVEVEPERLAAIAAGSSWVAVKLPPQGVARVGDGLRVRVRVEGDGTIEDARRRFMLGVPWQPEEDEVDPG